MQQNSFQNLTKKQKIGIIISFIIIVLLLFYIFIIFQQPQTNIETNNTSENLENQENITYIEPDSNTSESSNEYIQNLINNNYQYNLNDINSSFNHTTDPNLISTFLPHMEYRKHQDGELRSVYFYINYNDSNKIITIRIEDCDEQQDKIRADNYLKSIPLDLSEYKIEYNINTVDTDCSE